MTGGVTKRTGKETRLSLAALRHGVAFLLAVVLASCTTPPPKPEAAYTVRENDSSPFDVLTQHSDPARTGATLVEKRLNPETVASGQFRRLFEWDVDGQIYTQPLYLSHVVVGTRTLNMVIVATMNNSVFAFEAPAVDSDQKPQGRYLWSLDQKTLGTPLKFNFMLMGWGISGHNINPQIGVVATPVIDRTRGLIYLSSKSGTAGFFGIGRHIRYQLFAIDFRTGRVVRQVEIAAKATTPDGTVVAQFDASHELQRASLLEANGRIYLAFGAHQDTRPYHGWILAYDADTLAPVGSYCTTCGHVQHSDCDRSCQGGIWQAGGGPVADRNGQVYVMTGNGAFDGAVHDLSTSFVKLDASLQVVGAWTPPNYRCLNETDSDLGSAGPLLMEEPQGKPGETILIGGGKEGLLYAIRGDQLSGMALGPGTPGGLWDFNGDPCGFTPAPSTGTGTGPSSWTIQASPLWSGDFYMDVLRLVAPAGLAPGFHHSHGAPTLWTVDDGGGQKKSLLYLSAERDLLRAYEFNEGFTTESSRPGDPPVSTYTSVCPNSTTGMPGGFLTVSADGGDRRSGIVWAAMPRRNHDALNETVPGVLRAYRAVPDAGNTLTEIWNSDEGGHPPSDHDCSTEASVPQDELGLFAKFVPPTVSEGKVYMATFSHHLVVYGLKQTTSVSSAPVNAATVTPGEHRSELTTASLPGSVAPGQVVAVSIQAANTGTEPWSASDGIQLTSRFIPDLASQVVEGQRALNLTQDVAPGQSVTFSFRLRAPEREGDYYYQWRLRLGEAKPDSTGATTFGGTTPSWHFTVLRPECADLRARASAARMALPKVAPNMVVPADQVKAIQALTAEADRRHCRLTGGDM